jgi:choline dehydrogenase-like flavoprotein
LEYWKKTFGSTWHMTGTCKAGKDEKEDNVVVDSNGRVFGVENLRIADMSVVPFVPNNHTQTTAYLVGLMLGDKLVDEYGLDV